MQPKSLMLATSNPGKVVEIRALLLAQSDLTSLTLLTPRDWPDLLPDVDETGATFAENARLKAVALVKATGLPALADDSGLCVDALEGAPGVHSARWAGESATDLDRNRHLLSALAEVPTALRTAHFVCAVCLALPDGRLVAAEGTCEGVLLDAPRGTNGFGYDPLFLLPQFCLTMAELTLEAKNVYSHRAQAMLKIAPALRKLLV